jgi:lipid-A-disaccharide synthase
MIDSLRTLFYPLGFIASFFFLIRVLFQWIRSEQKGKSHVTKTFWIISLCGNAALTFHSLIQLQFPVALIQSLNGVISWRNLNIMKGKRKSLRTVICVFIIVILLILFLFLIQAIFFNAYDWMRAPTLPWDGQHALHVTIAWHFLGCTGMGLFASRFWIQWWMAEKNQSSALGKSFWWISLIGASISIAYFIRLYDIVNLLGYSLGIVPYIRNLFLLQKNRIADSPSKNCLFLFAGEQSGDILGGELIKSLKKAPFALCGVGGRNMKNAGLNCIANMEKFQVMGFSAVFKALPRLLIYMHKIKRYILNFQPKAVILIDYPDFNLLLAKKLRKSGYQGKIVHYVCPTIWAWRRKRIKNLVKYFDLLLTIFPFEKKYFSSTSLTVHYVGHPLVAKIKQHTYRSTFYETFSLPSGKKMIALFPGSRSHEIQLNLPLQLEAVSALILENSGLYAVISVARPELEDEIQNIVNKSFVKPLLIPGDNRFEMMQEAFIAIATSGTITLELALHQVPTVVMYKITPLNYFLGKYLFRIHLPYFCIVNIICDMEIFPEFIEKKIDREAIKKSLKNMMSERQSYSDRCQILKELLLDANSSDHAAESILHALE